MTVSDKEPLVRLAELEIEPSRLKTYLNLLGEEIDASLAREPGVLTLCAL